MFITFKAVYCTDDGICGCVCNTVENLGFRLPQIYQNEFLSREQSTFLSLFVCVRVRARACV
jgi:hypothetical protein